MGILVVYFFTVILIQVYFEYLIILLSISGSKDSKSARTGQIYLLFSQYKSSTLKSNLKYI